MHDALMLLADCIYIIIESPCFTVPVRHLYSSPCFTVPVRHVYSSQPQSLEEILKKKKQEREEAAKVMAEFFACMHACKQGSALWIRSLDGQHSTVPLH